MLKRESFQQEFTDYARSMRHFQDRLRALHELSIELATAVTFDELCRQAIKLGRSRLGFDRLGLWLYDQNYEYMVGTFGIDETGELRDERDRRVPIDYDPVEARTSGRSIVYLVEDSELHNDRNQAVGHGWRTAARLWDGNQTIGWLAADNLLSQQPLTEDTVELLTLYAVTLGHLVSRKHKEDALRDNEVVALRFQAKLKALHELSVELATVDSFDDFCHRAIVLGRTKLDFDRLGLWFYDEDPTFMLGSFGTDEYGTIRDERGQRVVSEFTPMNEVLGGRVVFASDPDTPLYNDRSQIIGHGWKAAAKLWNGYQTIGWLSTDNLLRKLPADDYQLELLALYASTLGHLATRKRAESALRRSQEAAQEFQEKLKALHEVSIELAKLGSLDDLYRNAVELGRSRLGFDRIGIFLVEDENIMVGTYGTDQHGVVRYERHLRRAFDPTSPVVEVLRNKTRVTIWQDAPLYDDWGEVGRGWNAMALLWEGDAGIGWLAADNLLKQEPLRDYQPELLSLYGAILGHLFSRKQTEVRLKEAEQQSLDLAIERERVKLLTEFIGNISHDLKTPLSVIKATLYLLERLTDPEKQKDRLDVIKEQTQRLERFIQDILTVSRLEHLTNLNRAPVDLNHLVTLNVNKLRPTADRKNITTTLELEAPDTPLIANEKEVGRMLINLIENAVNYTPGGGMVTVRTRSENAGVVIEVADTGIGIGDDDLPHIFEPFYRADKARNLEESGTGLGLAIAKKIVDMHSGSIDVQSVPGAGSTFRVHLPCLDNGKG